MKREFSWNPSGNEVDYMNSLIRPVKNMMCSKLDCQKGFKLFLFSATILGGLRLGIWGLGPGSGFRVQGLR